MNAIGDLASVARGRSRHRPRNAPSLFGGEYPFVQTADVHAADLYISTYSQTYNERGLAQSKLWEPGALCITIAGENTGDCAILAIRACFPDSVVGIVADPTRADTVFLKYAIDGLRPQLRNITRGATQDNLSIKKLLVFPFPIRTATPGQDHAVGLTMDLSQIDFGKLRDEFAHKVRRKHAALQDIRDIVEKKLAQMLARNPTRMDYYRKYQEIIADYNREKDRVTVEETFAKLVALATSLDAEQRRTIEEGLSEDELALFDLLFKDNISKADRERLKQASKSLLTSLRELLEVVQDWTKKVSTQSEVKVFILNKLYRDLPRPPFTDQDTEETAARVYDYVWQRSASGSHLV